MKFRVWKHQYALHLCILQFLRLSQEIWNFKAKYLYEQILLRERCTCFHNQDLFFIFSFNRKITLPFCSVLAPIAIPWTIAIPWPMALALQSGTAEQTGFKKFNIREKNPSCQSRYTTLHFRKKSGHYFSAPLVF